MVDDEDLEVEEGEIDTFGDDSEAAPNAEGPSQNAREMSEKFKTQTPCSKIRTQENILIYELAGKMAAELRLFCRSRYSGRLHLHPHCLDAVLDPLLDGVFIPAVSFLKEAILFQLGERILYQLIAQFGDGSFEGVIDRRGSIGSS